jgi:hypothetical protein
MVKLRLIVQNPSKVKMPPCSVEGDELISEKDHCLFQKVKMSDQGFLMRPAYRRIICRKLPPTVTEEAFKNIEFVRSLVDQCVATVQFYQADIVGDTSAPPSATAIITIFGGSESFINDFTSLMAQQKFPHPLKQSPTSPQVELAPVQTLPPEPPVPPVQKQLASIDEDPDFMQFAKDFGTSYIPATDSLLSHEEILQDPVLDSANVLRALNDRLSGRSGGASGGKKGGKKNRGRRGGRHD